MQDDQPDFDLISMVQQARMLHDQQAVPSQIDAVYWIEARATSPDVKPASSQPGQWMLETTVANVDAHWAQIKTATEANQLGYKSKVSTASRTGGTSARTICVCTYNHQDEADVARIGEFLKALLPGDWQFESSNPPVDVSNR